MTSNSYVVLARKYRPQRLAVEGRVYDPTPEFPYGIVMRPWLRGIMISVSKDKKMGEQLVPTAHSMDDPVLEEVVRQLVDKLNRET